MRRFFIAKITSKLSGNYWFAAVAMVLMFCCMSAAKASHLYGAEINVVHDTGAVYIATVYVYRDCGNKIASGTDLGYSVSGGSSFISMGAGTCCAKDITPRTDTSSCDLCRSAACTYGFGVQRIITIGKADLKDAGDCKITFRWEECCMGTNTAVVGGSSFAVTSTIDRCIKEQNTPVFQYPPVFTICVNHLFDQFQSVFPGGASDSIVYKLADPINEPGSSMSFYSPYSASYPIAYLGTDPDAKLPKGFHFNTVTGELAFTPIEQMSSVLTIEADDYQKDDKGKYYLASSITRSNIVFVKDCDNNNNTPPILTGINGTKTDTLITCANIPLKFTVNTLDVNKSDSLTLTADSPYVGHVEITRQKWPFATVRWTPKPQDISTKPYYITFTAKDNAIPMYGEVQKRIYILVKDTFPVTGFTVKDKGCGTYDMRLNPAPPASSKVTFQWTVDGSVVSKDSIYTFSTDRAGSHKVSLLVNQPGKCSLTYDTVLSYHPDVFVSPLHPLTCSSKPVFIKVDNLDSIQWIPSTGIADPHASATYANPKAPTQYTIKGVDINGCHITTSVRVALTDTAVKINAPAAVCQGTTVTITASGGQNYIWRYDRSIAGSLDKKMITANPAVPTTYHVTIYDSISKCNLLDSVTVYVSNNRHLPDISICQGSTAHLFESAGSSYTWAPNYRISSNAGKEIFASPRTTNYYMCHVKDSASGCIRVDSVLVKTDNACVLPGDADLDGNADYRDVLQLGLSMGKKGKARKTADTLWKTYSLPVWASYRADSINNVYSDCDGNGVISDADTAMISAHYNYGYYPYNPPVADAFAPPVFIQFLKDTFYAGETVQALVSAGTFAAQVQNPYGIAYQIHVSVPAAAPGTFQVTPFCDLLCDTGILNYQHVNMQDSTYDIAAVRTNGQPSVKTIGKVGTIWFTASDTNTYKYPANGVEVYLQLKNAEIIDNNGVVIPVRRYGDYAVIMPHRKTGIEDKNVNGYIKIYPNPAHESITIDASGGEAMQIAIYNADGKMVSGISSCTGTLTIDTSRLPAGIYGIKVQSDKGLYVQKIVIEK